MTAPMEPTQPAQPPLRVVDLLFDEDTEVAFASGDVDETAMRIALALALVTDLEVEREEALDGAFSAKFERLWMRDDPDDEYGERMLPCSPDDDGAVRFAILSDFTR